MTTSVPCQRYCHHPFLSVQFNCPFWSHLPLANTSTRECHPVLSVRLRDPLYPLPVPVESQLIPLDPDLLVCLLAL